MAKGRKTSILFAGVAGLAAGLAIGLLLAPERGSKTRKKLRKKLREVSDNFQEEFADEIEKVKAALNLEEEEPTRAPGNVGKKSSKQRK